MARPTKQGIDYFPYDVDIDQDDKLSMIIGEFGYKGELIFTKLLAWIYKNDGYFVPWNEMEQLKFANRVAYALGNAQVNLVKTVVARCIKWGLFDERLYESSHILTSVRIQETWYEATKRRLGRKINHGIWLVEINDDTGDTKTGLMDDNNPQTKEKETKEKQNKEKDYEDFVPPSLQDVKDFFKENGYNNETAIKAFDYYSCANWKDSKGMPVKSWKQKMIAVWFKPENKVPPPVESFMVKLLPPKR